MVNTIKNGIISIAIIAIASFSLSSCGNESNTAVSEEITTSESISPTTERAETTEKTTEQIEEVSEAKIDNNESVVKESKASETDPEDKTVIKLENDGINGKAVDEDGMKKNPIITNKLLNQKYETGDFELTVVSAQLAELYATSEEVAEYLDIEMNKEYVLFGIGITVENKSDKDESIYPNISTIVTNTKEQVNSLVNVSDDVGGDFYGNVIKEGQVFFLCQKSDINDINHIKWRIDPPNINGETTGEALNIEFDLIK